MERVVLIGDSIRMGYQATVEKELAGEAEVWEPEVNGGNSRKVKEHLDAWALASPSKVIHINCGLHDLKVEFGDEESAVPLTEYRQNVEEILRRLVTQTQAQVIWAATTPVNEAWHHERKGFDRFESYVAAYNEAASEICEKLDIPVNDLHGMVLEAGRDRLLTPDGVHFVEEGSVLLGKAVAKAVREYL
ncbi:MAG: GDSL-type esterase/lipase family protein [Candidatus Latescibacteria bacterium]|jgi:lysophospholipase L1-like esterase|nr:GDSL-type esterase/lipase family protein [Candidatus Latescibacterota bacterium]